MKRNVKFAGVKVLTNIMSEGGSPKKNDIFWEFFPNRQTSLPPPLFWEFRPFFADFFWSSLKYLGDFKGVFRATVYEQQVLGIG